MSSLSELSEFAPHESENDVAQRTLKEGADVQVVTLGCRLNIHESDVMHQLAQKAGLKKTIIVNTCAVTAEAERQARQTIRKLKKENPDAYLIATGCAVQMRPEAFAQMSQIDRLIGNDIKLEAASYAPDFEYRAKVGNIMKVKTADLPLVHHFKGKIKAFLQVQNGCNHHCTFCTIPLGRGKSRSVPMGAIVQQAQLMLQAGVQEIVLTGVDMTSYGPDLPGEPSLAQMIRRLLNLVPELSRLRLSSLDSIEVDPDLLDLLISETRILPHLHLSLQSGDDTILKLMRRRHQRHQALHLCSVIRQKRPEMAIGADFIVGFPGETEAMFQNTLDFVKEQNLTHLHVFPFSPRPGTVAAQLPDPVPHAVIKERALRLRTLGEENLQRWLKRKEESQDIILVEKPGQGHTDDFCAVRFLEASFPSKGLFKARLTAAQDKFILAEPLPF